MTILNASSRSLTHKQKREVVLLMSQLIHAGMKVKNAAKHVGISDVTYYAWKKHFRLTEKELETTGPLFDQIAEQDWKLKKAKDASAKAEKKKEQQESEELQRALDEMEEQLTAPTTTPAPAAEPAHRNPFDEILNEVKWELIHHAADKVYEQFKARMAAEMNAAIGNLPVPSYYKKDDE